MAAFSELSSFEGPDFEISVHNIESSKLKHQNAPFRNTSTVHATPAMSTTITTPNDVMVTAQAADTPPSPSLRPADAPDGATPPTTTKKNLTLALNIFFLLFCLYFFLVGLGLMGDSFKILAGKSAGNLFKAADHPIAGTCWPQPFHGRTPFWRVSTFRVSLSSSWSLCFS
jgi:hypothetical protein